MTPKQRKACHAIIHGASASAAAAGLGLAQLPGSDNAVIIPIHIGMVVSLGKVFDVHVTDSLAKGLLLGVSAAEGARAVSQVLVGWIPGLGNAVNASTAAGLTEAIGWAVARAKFPPESEHGRPGLLLANAFLDIARFDLAGIAKRLDEAESMLGDSTAELSSPPRAEQRAVLAGAALSG